jgi:hypothetical protein
MKYLPDIHEASSDPQRLEDLYQSARKQKENDEFVADLMACYEEAPENLLYKTWYYRLKAEPQVQPQKESRRTYWKLAVPLGILNGLVFWILSDHRLVFLDNLPYLTLLCAPITAIFVMGFITFGSQQNHRRYIYMSVGLALASLYVLLLARTQQSQYHHDYLILAVLHLFALAWIATGLHVLGRGSTSQDRFAFLIKSLEVFVTGGVYVIVGGIFAGITIGMFQALSITIPDIVLRLIFAGGGGLIPVLAVASVYDPLLAPFSQDFTQGLSKFVATMMRLILPLTLLVLVVYVFVIPFNFMEPFKNRDVLIVYNVMLFAIMGLLVGTTPITVDDLSPKLQAALRNGILAVAVLTVLVSLYALSAILYRTVLGGITINRLTVIGWNTINIAILILLIYRLLRGERQAWVDQLKATFKIGTVGYTIWVLFTIIAIPLIFR